MTWFLILEYVLCPIVLLIQILGLILLYRRKQISRNKNQIYILIALCHTESTFAMLSTLYMFQLAPLRVTTLLEKYLSVLYYSFMILLTSDRFLIFYLNMKYPIYCTPRKLLKIIISVVVVPMVLILILALAIQFQLINYLSISIVTQYMYISVDTFYIIIVIITYTYIFVQFRCRKKLKRNTSVTRRKNQDHFNLKLPTLIIATFILFNVCPNFWGIFIKNSPQDELSVELVIPHLMYLLGWIADPLIYVCTHRTKARSQSTRKTLEKPVKFSRVDNEDIRTASVIF